MIESPEEYEIWMQMINSLFPKNKIQRFKLISSEQGKFSPGLKRFSPCWTDMTIDN